MVFCSDCKRVYSAETNKNWEKQVVKKYRHRISMGHCINRNITEKRLERIVWERVVLALLNPEVLEQGYLESLERQEIAQKRQRAHLETLNQKCINLKKQRENLTAAYLDPEIGLTKNEFVEQKARIDRELKEVLDEISSLEKELEAIPTPAEFETLQRFAEKIRVRLENNIDPTPQEKKKLIELFHIKVWVPVDGKITVTGWLDGRNDGELPSASR